MFVISQCKGTKLDQKQGSTSCPTEGAEEQDNIFSPQGGKLAKSEEIQPHHFIIQLILFSCYLAFAPLMHRGDYALHMHRRNHSFFSPNASLSSLVWTYLPLEELCCHPIPAHSLGVLWGHLVCDQEEVKLERTLHHTYCCLSKTWPPRTERETHTDKEVENFQSAWMHC